MPYYVFAIGGTGARCLESLLYLCAMGLGPKELHPILVDPDSGNGNLNRTKELIIRYKEIRSKINNPDKGSLFYTGVLFEEQETGPDVAIQVPNYFNPNTGLEPGMNTLSHFIDYNTRLQQDDGKHLADLLFSKNELEMDMAQGYRGVPSIGSILMTNIQNHKIWDVLVASLKADLESKVFIFASVFGGTGASGYPVISRLIKNGAPNAKVGGALLLPYFRLPDPKNLIQQRESLKKEKVLPDSNSFMVNSKAACEFYKNNFSGVDSNYVLGDDLETCAEYKNYQIGSKDQKNDAHMIELFSAYAALDFWSKTGDNYKPFYHIQVQNPQNNDNPSFKILASDLPDAKTSSPFERFALLYHYISELDDLAENQNSSLINKIAWLRSSGMKGKDVLAHKTEMHLLRTFFDTYKNWISQNHANSAPLCILDENLNMDCLLQEHPKRYRNYPISRLDTKLWRSHVRGNSLTETLIKAASLTCITAERRG
jgi:hypothetical protein